MLKYISKSLISMIFPALAVCLYYLFEHKILYILSTWPHSQTPSRLLRSLCLLVCLVIFVLSYLIAHFRDKYLKLKNRQQKKEITNTTVTPAIERNPPEKQNRDYKEMQTLIDSFEWDDTGQCLGNIKT